MILTFSQLFFWDSWILVYCRFNNYFTVFLICSFYFCLVKEVWALKVAKQFAIRGLVGYKPVAYKKDKCNSIIWRHLLKITKFWLDDGKALKTLIIASVKILKRENKKCGREEFLKLVNNSLCNRICKDRSNKTLDRLIENQSVKCNIVRSRQCLSLPKDSELYHRSIQSTQDASSFHEHLTPCHLSDSEIYEKSSLSMKNLKHLI